MKISKTLAAVLALCLSGMMLTACGKTDDANKGSDTDARQTDTAEDRRTDTDNDVSDTSDVSVITDEDNPGRSRDIDGDGFIEDVVTAAEDIVDDVVDGAEDILDDMTPDEHDNSTVTTTDSD